MNNLKMTIRGKKLERSRASYWKPRLSGNQSWKNEEDSGEVNDGYLPEDLVLIASPDSCKGSWHNQSPC